MTIPPHLVKQAVVGTSRPVTANEPDNDHLSEHLVSYEPEARLLLQVAATALQQDTRLLRVPDQDKIVEPAEPETVPRCTTRAIHYLELMLSGLYHDLLPEWFYEVAAAKRRVPEEALYRLTKLTNKDRELLRAVSPVLGNRGHWLIKQIAEPPTQASRLQRKDPAATNSPDEVAHRIQQAMDIQGQDSTQSLDMTADICEKLEKAELGFLRQLYTQLGSVLVNFVEQAIEIRRFRMWGAYLLHDLTPTGFAGEVEAATSQIMKLHRVGHQERLSVDFVWSGSTDRTQKQEQRRAIIEHFIVRHVQWEPEEMLALVQPSFWCEQWQISADDLIRAARNSEHTHVFFSAWIDATLQFKDVKFAQALLTHRRLHELPHEMRPQLAELLSASQLEECAILWLDRLNASFDEYHPAVPILKAHQETWSVALMSKFLATLEQSFSHMKRPLLSPIRHLLRTFAPYFPVAMKDELHRVLLLGQHDKLSDNELKIINEFVGLINFRMEMVDAIRN